MKDSESIGVVVGRFQFYFPHSGHSALIEHALSRHERVLVLLGYDNVRYRPNNAFPPEIRSQMLKGMYPELEIDLIPDSQVSEVEWSERLDAVVQSHAKEKGAILYGGRDSFIKDYHGIHETSEIPEVPGLSASKLRKEIDLNPVDSDDYRLGFLHAILKQYIITDPAVDMAIHSADFSRVLLGRRGTDSPPRFCGGFVDPTDDSYEAAVQREQSEEVLGVEVGDPVYVGSKRIDDSRYQGSEYGIMTAFYAMEYQSGEPVGGDDMEKGGVDWYSLNEDLFDLMTPTHHPLLKMLLEYQEKRTQ